MSPATPGGGCSGARASCVVAAPGVAGAPGRGGAGGAGAAAPAGPERLRPRMVVSASLKRARSASAWGGPKTKV
jgi:hypothetical protein